MEREPRFIEGIDYITVHTTQMSNVRRGKGERPIFIWAAGPKGGLGTHSMIDMDEATKLSAALIKAVAKLKKGR